MKDVQIKASGETCPCGLAKFSRIARCNEYTDFLNLHYDRCICGFITYAYNDTTEKQKRYDKWIAGLPYANRHKLAKIKQEQLELHEAKWLFGCIAVAGMIAYAVARLLW